MYSDPQSVTVNGSAKTLPRVSATNTKGRYITADGLFTLEIQQNQSANRFRREARLTQKKVATDPISAMNKEVSTSVMIIVDEPKWGFDDTELAFLTNAITAWFAAASNVARDKLFGGEL